MRHLKRLNEAYEGGRGEPTATYCDQPLDEGELRVVAAAALTAIGNQPFECWRDGELVGILLLSRIVPKIDALFHFIFFDSNMVGKRLLLRQFLQDHCFGTMELNRVSLEVPEHQHRYREFCRRVLGFRYEGEALPLSHPDLAVDIASLGVDHTGKHRPLAPAEWTAKQGSRRERAYLHKDKWLDIQLLRLLPEDLVHATSRDHRSRRSGGRRAVQQKD